MTGLVHTLVGAAVGRLCRSKSGAFAAGLISHALIDAIPHKDIDYRIDVPITAAALTVIAKTTGSDSPELWGAVGGLVPDIEHGLEMAGLIEYKDKVFPSHVHNGVLHARETGGRGSQIILGTAALLALWLTRLRPRPR